MPRHLVYRGVPEASAPQMENMFGKDRRRYRSYNSVEKNIHVIINFVLRTCVRVVVNIDVKFEWTMEGLLLKQFLLTYCRYDAMEFPQRNNCSELRIVVFRLLSAEILSKYAEIRSKYLA